MIYNAQIYLTRCHHPSFEDVRYLGLDTKRNPDYLGSSAALKWMIAYVGREYFTKDILEEVTGTMSEICNIEQSYFQEYSCVADPRFLNRSGRSSYEIPIVGMETTAKPHNPEMKELTQRLCDDIFHERTSINNMIMICRKVINLAVYAKIKYNQLYIPLTFQKFYCSCSAEDINDILLSMESLNIIQINPKGYSLHRFFVIPEELVGCDFEVTNEEEY